MRHTRSICKHICPQVRFQYQSAVPSARVNGTYSCQTGILKESGGMVQWREDYHVDCVFEFGHVI